MWYSVSEVIYHATRGICHKLCSRSLIWITLWLRGHESYCRGHESYCGYLRAHPGYVREGRVSRTVVPYEHVNTKQHIWMKKARWPSAFLAGSKSVLASDDAGCFVVWHLLAALSVTPAPVFRQTGGDSTSPPVCFRLLSSGIWGRHRLSHHGFQTEHCAGDNSHQYNYLWGSQDSAGPSAKPKKMTILDVFLKNNYWINISFQQNSEYQQQFCSKLIFLIFFMRLRKAWSNQAQCVQGSLDSRVCGFHGHDAII